MNIKITASKRRISNVIIDSPERFIGRYKDHRISIIEIEKPQGKAYDIDVTDQRGVYAVETWEYLQDMEAAIEYAITQAGL